MTVFLTPDLKPFFGGTYFPPVDRDGTVGLKTILPRIHESWLKDHEKVVGFSDRVAKALREDAAAAPRKPGEIGKQELAGAAQQFASRFDAEHGGFGGAPKFPEPSVLNFLLHEYRRSHDPHDLDMVLRTLHGMADGGIHDHLGGGFHRYSTDARWFLPHFEKMLYDQAQLACVYLDAYRITADEFYAGVTRDILDYVLRDMTGPDGEFYSAEDADSALDPKMPEKTEEGAFYVWTSAQIESALGAADADVFIYRFGVEKGGNVKLDRRGEFTGRNVLAAAHSTEECAKRANRDVSQVQKSLEESRSKLLDVRAQRPRPRRDDKAIAAWNGLMISAFARAGRVLDKPKYTTAAERAASFVHSHLYDAHQRKLRRRFRDGQTAVDGFLSDYAFYIQGLLDLYENSPDIRWLKLALELQAAQDAAFRDEKGGGYFLAPAGDASLLVRQKDDADNAEPSGNSISALNLLRLSRMTDDRAMAERAGKTIACFGDHLTRAPADLPAMLTAIDFRLEKPRQVVIAGKPRAADTEAMLRAVQEKYVPNKVVLLADGAEGQAFLSSHVEFLKDVKPLDGRATAYVCENYACQLPTNNIEKLRKLIAEWK